MQKFLDRYHDPLSGFDRLVFDGTFRGLHQGYWRKQAGFCGCGGTVMADGVRSDSRGFEIPRSADGEPKVTDAAGRDEIEAP